MTYCAGMLVQDGLVMIADTRTNAGVDNISQYRKLCVVEKPGERILAVASAGNLSVTQTALNLVREGFMNPDTGQIETLEDVTSVFRAAKLIGHAVRHVRQSMAPSMEAENISYDVTLLLGGEILGQPMSLYLIYGQGNFIECGPDTPYLQIGECKYGKPILDRALNYETGLPEALKLGLISFDSTIRSNLAVGLPIDLITIRRGALRAQSKHRILADDPYFKDLGDRWSAALAQAQEGIPLPPYVENSAPKGPRAVA
jgi:putative proteasome-type protease